MNARIASVNVGRIRAVEWHRRTFTTAIWKAPVSGRVHIHANGLAGDERGPCFKLGLRMKTPHS